MNQEYPQIMDAVILTKSKMRKNEKTGACVTACDLKSGNLVRFVSDMDGSPIVSNKFDVLDHLRVKVICPCPIGPQQENLLVDTSSFQKVEPCNKHEIVNIFQSHCKPNRHDFMADFSYKLDSVESYKHSIEILRVDHLTTENETSKWNTKKEKWIAHFHCAFGWRRFFRVTDDQIYKRNGNIGDAYIVASIPTEPNEYDGYYYKFVAAIYPLDQPPFT